MLGFTVTVISSSVSSEEVAHSIDSFLEDFGALISCMSEEKFEDHVRARVQILQEPDISMLALTTRLWSEIAAQRYAYDLNARLIKWYSEKCSLHIILGLYKAWFGNNSRKLRLHIVGQSSSSRHRDAPPLNSLSAKTLYEMKKQLNLYPYQREICDD